MRPSEKFEAKAAGQKGSEAWFSPRRVHFWLTTQASGFAASPEFTPDVSSLACLSGAIERVIRIGSKRCHPFYSAKNAEILLYLGDFLVFRNFFVDRLVSIGQTIFRNKQQ